MHHVETVKIIATSSSISETSGFYNLLYFQSTLANFIDQGSQVGRAHDSD